MKVYVQSSPQHGKGVFAREPIVAGETIMVFSGPSLRRAEVDPDDYHLQIGDDLYLGASGGPDDYVNHSCRPNSGFADGLRLVAICDIAAGEEITWDYSTAIDEDDFEGFPCSCGAPGCRERVMSFRHLPPALQRALQPWLMPYLKIKYFR